MVELHQQAIEFVVLGRLEQSGDDRLSDVIQVAGGPLYPPTGAPDEVGGDPRGFGPAAEQLRQFLDGSRRPSLRAARSRQSRAQSREGAP